MQKLEYTFKGFTLTYQPNNTNNLLLIAINDMAASIAYPTLAVSTNISLKYSIINDYFNLFVYINDASKFFELNYHIDEKTKALAYAIDNNSVTDLWIGYYLNEKLVAFGTAIQLTPQHQ